MSTTYADIVGTVRRSFMAFVDGENSPFNADSMLAGVAYDAVDALGDAELAEVLASNLDVLGIVPATTGKSDLRGSLRAALQLAVVDDLSYLAEEVAMRPYAGRILPLLQQVSDYVRDRDQGDVDPDRIFDWAQDMLVTGVLDDRISLRLEMLRPMLLTMRYDNSLLHEGWTAQSVGDKLVVPLEMLVAMSRRYPRAFASAVHQELEDQMSVPASRV